MKRPPLVHSRQPLSRRAVIPGMLATAISGSAIAAGVVRGDPRLLVVGEDRWQIALLLSSRIRVLILTGELSPDAMATIPMLLSVMRQRIDVVIGTSAGLSMLPNEFRQRWMVRRFILVADDGDASIRTRAVDQVLYMPGAVRVEVSASPRNAWVKPSGEATRDAASLVTITRSGSIIAISSNLETIAELGSSSTTVAMAPIGSIDHVARRLRVPTICINAVHVPKPEVSFGSERPSPSGNRSIVRIFPTDVAEFGLRHDGIAIPAWRQRSAPAHGGLHKD